VDKRFPPNILKKFLQVLYDTKIDMCWEDMESRFPLSLGTR
jgi:hypothetical protein